MNNDLNHNIFYHQFVSTVDSLEYNWEISFDRGYTGRNIHHYFLYKKILHNRKQVFLWILWKMYIHRTEEYIWRKGVGEMVMAWEEMVMAWEEMVMAWEELAMVENHW